MILYNVNPSDTFQFATLIGCFQDGEKAGKIQYGSAWWFLDQKQGITAQIDALSNVGLLSRFIGMVTDSRSFMSYPRHEYFRRVLCDIVGQDVARGELPNDDALLGPADSGCLLQKRKGISSAAHGSSKFVGLNSLASLPYLPSYFQ